MEFLGSTLLTNLLLAALLVVIFVGPLDIWKYRRLARIMQDWRKS